MCRLLNVDYKGFTYFLQSRYPELIRRHNPKKNSEFARQCRKDTEKTYREAVKLCEDTDLTYKEIARMAGVKLEGLKAYIRKHRRDLMLKRLGMEVSKREANTIRVRGRETGQTLMGEEKYRDAIEACSNLKYIELTVAEIAREFNVTETGLLNQLREHFPEVVTRREEVRQRMGLDDNRQRGVRETTLSEYSTAIEMLRNTDKTIKEVAEECGVTFGGLRSHLLTYHKDVVELRRVRMEAREKAGWKFEKGSIRASNREATSRYDEAIEKLREGAGSVEAVANESGFVPESLRAHLKKYEPELYARYGSRKVENGRRVLTRTEEKYRAALEDYRTHGSTLKEIAAKHGLVYNSFRAWVKRRDPL